MKKLMMACGIILFANSSAKAAGALERSKVAEIAQVPCYAEMNFSAANAHLGDAIASIKQAEVSMKTAQEFVQQTAGESSVNAHDYNRENELRACQEKCSRALTEAGAAVKALATSVSDVEIAKNRAITSRIELNAHNQSSVAFKTLTRKEKSQVEIITKVLKLLDNQIKTAEIFAQMSDEVSGTAIAQRAFLAMNEQPGMVKNLIEIAKEAHRLVHNLYYIRQQIKKVEQKYYSDNQPTESAVNEHYEGQKRETKTENVINDAAHSRFTLTQAENSQARLQTFKLVSAINAQVSLAEALARTQSYICNYEVGINQFQVGCEFYHCVTTLHQISSDAHQIAHDLPYYRDNIREIVEPSTKPKVKYKMQLMPNEWVIDDGKRAEERLRMGPY